MESCSWSFQKKFSSPNSNRTRTRDGPTLMVYVRRTRRRVVGRVGEKFRYEQEREETRAREK